MSVTPKYLRNLQEDICFHLEGIAKLFKNPKITIVIRNDELADGDVVLSDDDFDKAIAAIRHLQEKPTHFLPADNLAGAARPTEGETGK